ncbi:hypothetical protein GCM10020255_039260 [Rhodococcus baikonurensis]
MGERAPRALHSDHRGAVGGGGGDTLLLTCALAAIGVSRFVGAGVSAALPKVVRQSWLVATNSVLTTAGSVVAALGASAAVAIIGVIGAGIERRAQPWRSQRWDR